MSHFKRLRPPSPATVIATIALVFAATGFAVAAIPGAGGVIHACYQTGGTSGSPGAVRIIDDANSSCQAGEQAIAWNQTGPQGPAGPQGAAGPQGPQGPAGQDGTAGTLKRTSAAGSIALRLNPKRVTKVLYLPPGRWFVMFRTEISGYVIPADPNNVNLRFHGTVQCRLFGLSLDHLQTPTPIDDADLDFADVGSIEGSRQSQHLAMSGDLFVNPPGEKVSVGCSRAQAYMRARSTGARLFALRVP